MILIILFVRHLVNFVNMYIFINTIDEYFICGLAVYKPTAKSSEYTAKQ